MAQILPVSINFYIGKQNFPSVLFMRVSLTVTGILINFKL